MCKNHPVSLFTLFKFSRHLAINKPNRCKFSKGLGVFLVRIYETTRFVTERKEAEGPVPEHKRGQQDIIQRHVSLGKHKSVPRFAKVVPKNSPFLVIDV